MTYRSLNSQPEYIDECIKNNYNVLLRIGSINGDRKNARYVAGNLVNCDDSFPPNTPLNDMVFIQLHMHTFKDRHGHPAVKGYNLNCTKIDIMNLDEMI